MILENKYIKSLKISHTYLGIFAIFFFYISTFFGTLTVFKPYIATWESPSKYFQVIDKSKINLDIMITKGLKELNNPTNNVTITYPSLTEKALGMRYGFSENVYINPHTNNVLPTNHESQLLSNFFNKMHYDINMSKVGQFLMGITSIVMIFLTISGIYLWLLNRKKRAVISNFWLRWHKDLSLLMLPYIIVFSLTGAVLGIMLSLSSPFAYSASNGIETNMSKIVRPIIFSNPVKIKSENVKATMISYSRLYDIAKINYPILNISTISLFNWNDKNARIVFRGNLINNRILTSRTNRMNIVLNGETGEVVSKATLDNTHKVSHALSAFYFFHFITDEGILVRLIYLITGIIFAIGLVFGLFVWIEKKIKKENNSYFNIISKISTAFSIGIIPATAFTLCLYWLLPFNLENRDSWIIGGFYSMWSFTFCYSVYKKDSIDAAKDFFYLNAIFLISTVFLHGNTTNLFLWNSFEQSIWDIFYIDLFLLILGIGSAFFAIKMNKIKFLNKFKGY